MKWFLRSLGGCLIFCGGVWVFTCVLVTVLQVSPIYLLFVVPGVGAVWLGAWLWRRPQAKRRREREKQASEKQENTEVRQKKRAEQNRDWQERKALWVQERLEQERWLEEHPAQKAQFSYLGDMLSQGVLSFYDPSGREYSGMDESKNKTGGVWMRTPPVYDLEQVTALYQMLRDAGDHLSPEELRYAPDVVRSTVDTLRRHRRLYLRLCSERQLTALGERKDAFLDRCRKEGIHLFLQRSRNVIQDLTDGMDYEIHVEKTERDPLTGKEVTLGPANEPEEAAGAESGSEGRAKNIDEELRQMLRASEEQKRQKLLAYARTLEPDTRSRLERASDAFFHRMLWGVQPKYVKGPGVDDVSTVWNCFAVSIDADLNEVLDVWLDIRATASLSSDVFPYFRSHYYKGSASTFILDDAAQLDRSIGGKEVLLQRCQEYKVSLMLDLGDGYYQNLLTGEFYKLAVGSTWPGSADDAATYGELCWTKIGSLPSTPPMDWGSRERST